MTNNKNSNRDIKFYSSITNKDYYIRVNEKGYLSLFLADTEKEIPNYDNPSKKSIVRQALKDLDVEFSNSATVNNLIRKLYVTIINQNN